MLTDRCFFGAARWLLPSICLSAREYYSLIVVVLRVCGIPLLFRLLNLRFRLFNFSVNITTVVPLVILRLF